MLCHCLYSSSACANQGHSRGNPVVPFLIIGRREAKHLRALLEYKQWHSRLNPGRATS
jgi:hypothetical protein